ncbi:MAG TPA: hypothetical protein DCM45_07330 [Clostridiales bacterium]|nr:hypothetical protein [Clostridiales bacterium]
MQCEGCTLFTAKDSQIYSQLQQQNRSEISDNCLNSRVAWNAGFYYQKAMIAGCLTLVSDGGVFTTPHVAWPTGLTNQAQLKAIIDILWNAFQARGWPLRLMYIDEANLPLLQDLPDYQIQISHNPDYSDYLYDAAELRDLSGKDLHGKRNHFNRFCRSYPDYVYSPAQASDRDEALSLVKAWCDEKKLDCLNLCLSDYRAIRQLYEDFDSLDIRGGSIRIGGRLAAFALGSLLDGDTAVIHFEKADATYHGIYSAINKLVLDHAFPEVRYVNREEDMGIGGLRKAKQSYGPIRLIHKYEAVLLKA